ncbi:MAG TPA: hypothetical protein VGD67_09855 [Pseudonocardiaceae bacterium]
MACTSSLALDIRTTGATPAGWVLREPTGTARFACRTHRVRIVGSHAWVTAAALAHTRGSR